MPMVTKVVMVMKYLEELSPINLHDLWIKWSCEVTLQLNLLYLHLQKTHVTERDRMLTKHERLPPLKSHDPFITWAEWGLVTNAKIHIAFVTRFVGVKFCKVLTLGRKFSMQMLKCTLIRACCRNWQHGCVFYGKISEKRHYVCLHPLNRCHFYPFLMKIYFSKLRALDWVR